MSAAWLYLSVFHAVVLLPVCVFMCVPVMFRRLWADDKGVLFCVLVFFLVGIVESFLDRRPEIRQVSMMLLEWLAR